jgi:hypothetical protein
MSITGNLLALSVDMRGLTFEYAADERCLASLNTEPRMITIDGNPAVVQSVKGNDCYTVFLPTGQHRVEIVAGDPFSYGLNVASFWSTTAIAVFGLVAVVLLLIMYLAVVWVRRRIAATVH